MAQVTVEGLSKDEETMLRGLADTYISPDFLDFQDIPAVSMMAQGLQRLLARLTVKPTSAAPAEPGKKVKFIS